MHRCVHLASTLGFSQDKQVDQLCRIAKHSQQFSVLATPHKNASAGAVWLAKAHALCPATPTLATVPSFRHSLHLAQLLAMTISVPLAFWCTVGQEHAGQWWQSVLQAQSCRLRATHMDRTETAICFVNNLKRTQIRLHPGLSHTRVFLGPC